LVNEQKTLQTNIAMMICMTLDCVGLTQTIVRWHSL